jgi:glyoxylase-like metal-dependent hydrolase (beta-lactamase superfamily II)
MQLSSLEGNRQQLDGGAMFGNCPRGLWSRWCTPDAENRIPLACRALLAREDSGRLILFEAGVGAFFEPRMRDRYGVVESEHMLLCSLSEAGASPEDIDVVVLSHLHFDHAGGLLAAWREGEPARLAFPNAHYVVGAEAWERACRPHSRDRASFIPDLPELLEATGRVERVTTTTTAMSATLGPGYRFTFSHGHTPGMMLTRIEGDESGPLHFLGDLIPGVPWIHVPITMGYDRNPELLVDEKRGLLEQLVESGERVFLFHDPEVATCRIARDERGRFHAVEKASELGSTRD